MRIAPISRSLLFPGHVQKPPRGSDKADFRILELHARPSFVSVTGTDALVSVFTIFGRVIATPIEASAIFCLGRRTCAREGALALILFNQQHDPACPGPQLNS